MSTFSIDPTMLGAFGIIVKASLLLVVAVIVQALLPRRTSAATRHLVWTIAMASVLALPVVTLALPAWAVVIHTSSAPSQAVYHAADPADLSSAPAPVAATSPRPLPCLPPSQAPPP